MSALKAYDQEKYADFLARQTPYNDLLKLVHYSTAIDKDGALFTQAILRAVFSFALILQLEGNHSVDKIAMTVSIDETKSPKKVGPHLSDVEINAISFALRWKREMNWDLGLEGSVANWIDGCFKAFSSVADAHKGLIYPIILLVIFRPPFTFATVCTETPAARAMARSESGGCCRRSSSILGTGEGRKGGAAGVLALGLGPLHPRLHPLGDQRALELGRATP